MNYDIAARETVYNGITFRSRLEAKWAAFFELSGWDWHYEPCELNGFIPDFIIKTTSSAYQTNTIIVEIKPSVLLDEKEVKVLYDKYNGIKAHLLILTDTPFYFNSSGHLVIGKGLQYSEFIDQFSSKDLYDFEMKCGDDFGSSYMSYDGMIYGNVERKIFLDFSDDTHDIMSRWINAAEQVRLIVKNKKQ